MSFTLKVHSYRSLRHVELSPNGMCAIVGPDGAGKPTLVHIPDLLRQTAELRFLQAIEVHGGIGLLKTVGTEEHERVAFELAAG